MKDREPLELGSASALRAVDVPLAVDPPSLDSPRVPGRDREGLPVLFLQQTHNGVPVWICGCVTLTLGAVKPEKCLACGVDLPEGSEAFHPDVVILPERPDEIVTP